MYAKSNNLQINKHNLFHSIARYPLQNQLAKGFEQFRKYENFIHLEKNEIFTFNNMIHIKFNILFPQKILWIKGHEILGFQEENLLNQSIAKLIPNSFTNYIVDFFSDFSNDFIFLTDKEGNLILCKKTLKLLLNAGIPFLFGSIAIVENDNFILADQNGKIDSMSKNIKNQLKLIEFQNKTLFDFTKDQFFDLPSTKLA